MTFTMGQSSFRHTHHGNTQIQYCIMTTVPSPRNTFLILQGSSDFTYTIIIYTNIVSALVSGHSFNPILTKFGIVLSFVIEKV